MSISPLITGLATMLLLTSCSRGVEAPEKQDSVAEPVSGQPASIDRLP